MSNLFVQSAFSVALLPILISCVSQRNHNKFEAFFENSRRRPATAKEHKNIGSTHGCSGSFLKNKQNKTLYMSARHCFKYDEKSWCENQGIVKDHELNKTQSCKKIVARDVNYDFVVMELNGRRREGFRLADFVAGESVRLKMIGFPSDEESKGNMIVTENCWVQKSKVPNSPPEEDEARKEMKDQLFSHNCSTYGGNSGGPMLIEGTDIVVGIPYRYSKNTSNLFSSLSTVGATIGNYSAVFKKELNSNGVITAETPDNALIGNYLASGRYSSFEAKKHLNIIPLFDSGHQLKSIKVSETENPTIEFYYHCDSKGHKCNTANSSIQLISNSTFELIQENQTKTFFEKNTNLQSKEESKNTQ